MMKYGAAALALAAAVHASPFPQGVTQAIAPSAAAPSGCNVAYTGSFGIAVMNMTAGSVAAGGASTAAIPSQISDGQPQAPTSGVPISQISDGQPQAPTATVPPVSQISDGQPQAPTAKTASTAAPISQISDGQPQAPTAKPTSTAAPISQISDGQPQATKSKVTSTVQLTTTVAAGTKTATASAAPIAQLAAEEPKGADSPKGFIAKVRGNVENGMRKRDVGMNLLKAKRVPSPQASGPNIVGCSSNSTLTLTLNNGVLKDSMGRTGYIASNFQFQFDDPPQAGTIYSSEFSVCGNGSLALGGNAVWYQCLSGNFYNLYDRNWAAQCSPLIISALQLQNCS